MKGLNYFLASILVFLVAGCSTDVTDQIYASDKPVFVVYSVLNPNFSIQNIRIEGGYQVDSSALEHAENNNLSITGLNVQLSGGGHVYDAVETDTLPKDSGLFFPEQSIYQILTDGSSEAPRLTEGAKYTLLISNSDGEALVKGETLIPFELRIDKKIRAGAGSEFCLNKVNLEKPFEVVFDGGTAWGWDVRMELRIKKDGQDFTQSWGPSSLFREGNCESSSSTECFEFRENEVVEYLTTKLQEPAPNKYTLNESFECNADTGLLVKSVFVEVTASDEYLTKYIVANSPSFSDLTGAKPEYTNLVELSSEVIALGVFGSINTDRKYFVLGDCAKFLLGINNTSEPFGCQ